jgi:putative ABC transport system ATP-binding protein
MNNLSTVSTDGGSNGALIHISNLTKSYQTEAGAIHVLKDVNLRIYPGEIVAVMGPSGSGKSTLLFILGIFISPTQGAYVLGGQDVLRLDRDAQAEFRRNRVGFVFQSCDLLEHSTVYENLEYPLIYAGVDRKDRPAPRSRCPPRPGGRWRWWRDK